MSHVVTGPLAIVRTQSGHQVYVYQGSPLPQDAADGEAERLVAVGLVEEVTSGPAAVKAPTKDDDKAPATRKGS